MTAVFLCMLMAGCDVWVMCQLCCSRMYPCLCAPLSQLSLASLCNLCCPFLHCLPLTWHTQATEDMTDETRRAHMQAIEAQQTFDLKVVQKATGKLVTMQVRGCAPAPRRRRRRCRLVVGLEVGGVIGDWGASYRGIGLRSEARGKVCDGTCL